MKLIILLSVFSSQLIDHYNGDIELSNQQARTLVTNVLANPSSDYIETLAYYWSGVHYQEENKYAHAIKEYVQALNLITELDTTDYFLEIAIRKNMGAILDDYGDYNQAISFYQQALPYAEKYSDHEVAIIYLNMGNSYRDLGDGEKVMSSYMHALDIFKKSQNYYYIARTYHKLGQSFYLAKDYERASFYLNKSISYQHYFKKTSTTGISHHLLGLMAFDQREYQTAADQYLSALPYLSADAQYLVYLDLIEMYNTSGNYKQAGVWLGNAKRQYNPGDERPQRHLILAHEIEYLNGIGADPDSYVDLAVSLSRKQLEIATIKNNASDQASAAYITGMMAAWERERLEREKRKQLQNKIVWIGSISGSVILLLIIFYQMKSRSRKKSIDKMEMEIRSILAS